MRRLRYPHTRRSRFQFALALLGDGLIWLISCRAAYSARTGAVNGLTLRFAPCGERIRFDRYLFRGNALLLSLPDRGGGFGMPAIIGGKVMIDFLPTGPVFFVEPRNSYDLRSNAPLELSVAQSYHFGKTRFVGRGFRPLRNANRYHRILPPNFNSSRDRASHRFRDAGKIVRKTTPVNTMRD